VAQTIKITKVAPAYPLGVFVQWNYTAEAAGEFNFQIERSGSPEGPWTPVGNVTNGVTFYDTLVKSNDAANALSIERSIWYRVTLPNTTSVPMNLDGERANDVFQTGRGDDNILHKRTIYLRRKIIRDEALAFKVLNGIPVSILKRKHFGTRCPVCYDPLTKTTTKSRCTACYGTSWAGGYYAPIHTLARLVTGGAQTGLDSQGKSEYLQTTITLLNYPLVEEGDVIVEREIDRRYLVKQMSSTELRRLVVHQTVVTVELPRTAPEYSVRVDV
jgi:hypothetical protein